MLILHEVQTSFVGVAKEKAGISVCIFKKYSGGLP